MVGAGDCLWKQDGQHIMPRIHPSFPQEEGSFIWACPLPVNLSLVTVMGGWAWSQAKETQVRRGRAAFPLSLLDPGG